MYFVFDFTLNKILHGCVCLVQLTVCRVSTSGLLDPIFSKTTCHVAAGDYCHQIGIWSDDPLPNSDTFS